MKRPGLVYFLIVANVLILLAQVGFIGYLLALTRSPKILIGDDPAGTVHELKVAVAVFGVPALLWALSLVALFKRWRWGGWYGMALYVALAGLFLFDMADDWRDADSATMILAAFGMIMAGLYLVRPVRAYFADSAPTEAELVAGQGI